MMIYDDLYFASRYNFFTDCVEWYFLPKTEIKVFLKKMDIRGFGWRPSICKTIMIFNNCQCSTCTCCNHGHVKKCEKCHEDTK